MNTFTIFGIIGLILIVLGIILFVLGDKQLNDIISKLGAMLMISGLLLAGYAGVCNYNSNSIKETADKLSIERENLESETTLLYEEAGYKVFADGQEVALENIDIDFYYITIDKENKKLLLTSKKNSGEK